MALTAEQIEEFLDKLNSDPDFRDRLICDTKSVLAEYGISYGPDDHVAPSNVKLPSVGEVNANRDAFRDALFPDNEFIWDRHDFTASNTAR
jgi:putative modified peptide